MSIISNWTNPFANQVDGRVAAELKRRTRLLSSVSREQIGDTSINQVFSPRVSKEQDDKRGLEWVYQKMAYANVRPVKLIKSCEQKEDKITNIGNGGKSDEIQNDQIISRPERTGLYDNKAIPKQDKTYVEVLPRIDSRYGRINGELTRKPFQKLNVKKINAPFYISTRRFKDKNGTEGGVIERYGDDLYGVPGIYKDNSGKLRPTITNSPYRPTVENGDPNCVLTSLSIINEGVVGSVLRARMNFKVFTKEALNVIDEWLLRPGNEVIINWGWSTYALYEDLNNETLTAVIFNFSCEYREDNTWDVSIDAIAKGSLVSGVSFEVQDNAIDLTNNVDQNVRDLVGITVPNLQGLIKLELATLSGSLGPIEKTVDSIEGLKHLYGKIYESNIFPHGIAQFTHPIGSKEDPLVAWASAAGYILGGIGGAAGGIALGAGTPASIALGVGGAGAGAYGGSALGAALAREFTSQEFTVLQATYICLSDIVHFFNTILTNEYFPKDLETFEIQVENSPTLYDPNIVSSDPLKMMFSDNSSTSYNTGMSTYGESNRKILSHDHGDIKSFYHEHELNTWSDVIKNHKYGVPNSSKIRGNLGHIWISTTFIEEIFVRYKLDTGVDPRFKNIFSFFEEIFKLIAKCTGGAIRPSFVQQNLYDSQIKAQGNKSGIKSIIWIVDTNYMESQEVGTKNKYVFEVNNVGSTLLRDINVRLKLPSTMQSTAYTFGRAGLNDSIQTLDDIGCYDKNGNLINPTENNQDNYNKSYNSLQRLLICKGLAERSCGDPTVIESLQAALFSYVGSPAKSSFDNSAINQSWIFSRMYPAELSFEIDGMSGLKYGNMIKVKDILPARYFNKIYFTITKIEHTVVNHDWKLNVTTMARIESSENQFGAELSDTDIKNIFANSRIDGPLPETVDAPGQSGIQPTGTQ